jgi:phosphatidylserine decarboxylase
MRAMKHQGKARQAGLKLIFWTLVALLVLTAVGIVAAVVGMLAAAAAGFLFGAWAIFALLCLWFFRDPNPRVPLDADVIVSPAHGKVDLIDEGTEPEFLGGPCRRVSIFLSIFDVHVQKAPTAGKVACVRHTPGQFLNAMRSESGMQNENVFIGLESSERAGERIALRLIAGAIARRILPWVTVGEEVSRGERISLIQFGSRVTIYLPVNTKVEVQLGQHVRGGETVIARRG